MKLVLCVNGLKEKQENLDIDTLLMANKIMKYAVIDIGSNSVRLMLSDGQNTEYKQVKTTRLAENMGTDKILQVEPINRTVSAVSFFVQKAKEEKADKIFIYATAAVRQAKNRQEIIDKIQLQTGIIVDVIDGLLEAKLGAMGALSGADGGIIDVGGASSEVLVVKNGEIIYSKSINIGAVKVFNDCGDDTKKILSLVKKSVNEFGYIPKTKFYGIGGTATSLASISLKMEAYDPKIVHGYTIDLKQIKELRDRLFAMSLEQKRTLVGLQPDRAEVIAGGVAIIYQILRCACVGELIISESDNLEGYLSYKEVKDEKKD